MICVWRARAMNKHLPMTITVRSLRAHNNGSEVVVGVLLENGEYREQKNLPLTMEQYCEIKPTKGVITEEMYDLLEDASELCRAIRCGEYLLSFGANSVQMLTQKIMRHGYSKETAHRASKKLEEMGLIDEQSDLRREVEKCLKKLWGARRISSYLWSRGFSQDALGELPEMLEEIDFAANCARLIRKHYASLPNDADEQRRMIASLGRYGYTITEIRKAFQIVKVS